MDGTEPSTPATKAPVKTFPSREDKEFTKMVTGLIRSAFVALGKNKSFQGFWLADASIAEVINDKYRFSSVTTLDKTLLNKAVKPHVESQDMAADACNGDSIHSVTKRIPGVGRVMFYYFTPNAQDIKKPSYPGNLDGDGWLQLYQHGQEACENYLIRVGRQGRLRPKRQKPELDDIEIELNKLELAKAGKTKQTPSVPYEWSSFDAAEHKNIFNPNQNETLEECLDRRIALMTKAVTEFNGYKLLIPKGDPHDYYTSGQKATIHRRALYMRRAYMLAKQDLNDIDGGERDDNGRFSFRLCCAQAIDEIHTMLGIPKAKSDTLMLWTKSSRAGSGQPREQSRYCGSAASWIQPSTASTRKNTKIRMERLFQSCRIATCLEAAPTLPTRKLTCRIWLRRLESACRVRQSIMLSVLGRELSTFGLLLRTGSSAFHCRIGRLERSFGRKCLKPAAAEVTTVS